MDTYGITEVTKQFSIPASTLRYYESVGLLEHVRRDSAGQRVYDDSHLERIEGIQCFKTGGLPIAKICEFYRYDGNLAEHIDDIIALVADHELNLEHTIAELTKELAHIQQKARFYEGIKQAIDAGREWPAFEDYAI